MSGLVDTCPLSALGVTLETLELSGGSDRAVGLEDHLRCQGSCGEMLHSPRGGDLQIQRAPGPCRDRAGNLQEHLNTWDKRLPAHGWQRWLFPV